MSMVTSFAMGKKQQDRLQLCVCKHKQGAHNMTLSSEKEGEVPYPMYWDYRDSTVGDFKEVVDVDAASVAMFQSLFDETYMNRWTRDRMKHNPDMPYVPGSYRVVKAQRSENSKVWREYGVRRADLIAQRLETPKEEDRFAEYTDIKSAEAWVKHGGVLADRMKPECNEWYVFHGTNEKAAKTICAEDFKFSLAGGATGTLYGRGIYFSESIPKADEYAKPHADGIYTVLLCRVVGGNCLYTEELEPDPEKLLESCIEGPYDCIIGDRTRTRGTFREFVFYDTENFYAEYMIQYERIGKAPRPQAKAGAGGPSGALTSATSGAVLPR